VHGALYGCVRLLGTMYSCVLLSRRARLTGRAGGIHEMGIYSQRRRRSTGLQSPRVCAQCLVHREAAGTKV
jgi:hypothetical protein